MEEIYFYICDKQPGACKSWKRFNWKTCGNKNCFHTSNIKHAREKYEGKFYIFKTDNKIQYWEYTQVCKHNVRKCPAAFEVLNETENLVLCVHGFCPCENPGCGGF